MHGGIANKRPVEFIYKGGKYLQILSAKVLEEYYGEGNIHLYAFVPHSIYIRNYEQEKESQKRDIGQFKEIPLPSIGRLKGYSFNGNYHYIKFWVFLNLIDLYFEEGFSEYYCDISQGLNVYVDAFKEAFRSFALFDKLYNFDKGNIKIHLLYSDPILEGVEEPNLYDDLQIDVKVWFDSPIKDKEILNRNGLDVKAKRVLKNFYHTFKALKFNAPPVILTFGYDTKEEIIGVIKKLISDYKKDYYPGEFIQNMKTYEYRLPENPNEKISIFLALALYYNISCTLEKAGIEHERKTKEFTLEDFKKFYDVYEHYGLTVNRDMLERDVDRLPKNINADGDWRLLGECLRQTFIPRKKDELRNDVNTKRNFFAHSGMENNCVCVRKDGDRLLFKYREDLYDVIKDFLY